MEGSSFEMSDYPRRASLVGFLTDLAVRMF